MCTGLQEENHGAHDDEKDGLVAATVASFQPTHGGGEEGLEARRDQASLAGRLKGQDLSRN